jgi:conjugal transfer pilus assembly protein TraA
MRNKKQGTGLMILAGISVLLLATPAFAGADATFSEISGQIQAWMQGSLGMLMALFGGILGVGSAVKGDWAGLGTGIGVGAGAYYMPNILPTIVQGLI